MIHQTYALKEFFPSLSDSNAVLTAYAIANSKEIQPDRRRPGVLICPGGGYSFTSAREAEPVALQFVAAGISAFVLDYSVAPARYPAQLLEASAAMALMRRRAGEWNLNPDMLAVCGFSAGGHLAASLGTLWNEPFLPEALGTAPGENRPNAMVLCYPVITAGEMAHRGSFDCLLGENASLEQLRALSLETRVTPQTPPAFLWHTYNDPAVPVENTLLMAQALRRAGVEFDLHIYRDGVHGLSLCSGDTARAGDPQLINPHAQTWMGLCAQWMRDLFDYRA